MYLCFGRVKLIQLFSSVFCTVRVVHKSDCRLVMNETPNKGDQRREGNAVIETDVFDRVCMCFPARRREC
jgi:hypothetical protein